jgi:hypothetical protein
MCVYGACQYEWCGHDYKVPIYKCTEGKKLTKGTTCPNGYTIRLSDDQWDICPEHRSLGRKRRQKEFQERIEERLGMEGQLPDLRPEKKRKLDKAEDSHNRHCIMM